MNPITGVFKSWRLLTVFGGRGDYIEGRLVNLTLMTGVWIQEDMQVLQLGKKPLQSARAAVPKLHKEAGKATKRITSAPANEAGRLTTYLHLSLYTPKSSPPILSLVLHLLWSSIVFSVSYPVDHTDLPLWIALASFIAFSYPITPTDTPWGSEGNFNQRRKQDKRRRSPLTPFLHVQRLILIPGSDLLLWPLLTLYSHSQGTKQILRNTFLSSLL